MNTPLRTQRGSIIFYILIAVALLAALAYAVAQSGRGNLSQVSDERARLLADEILQYANAVSDAVAQLRLRGIADTDLCFDDAGWGGANYPNASCSDETTKIFGLKGGAITWKKAPAEAMDNAAAPDFLWGIYGRNEIQGVGTTCGAAACADLILVVGELSQKVCDQINLSLHVTQDGDSTPIDTDLDETRFNGTYAYQKTIGDEAGGALEGKGAACFQKTGAPGKYAFYKVLIAR